MQNYFGTIGMTTPNSLLRWRLKQIKDDLFFKGKTANTDKKTAEMIKSISSFGSLAITEICNDIMLSVAFVVEMNSECSQSGGAPAL